MYEEVLKLVRRPSLWQRSDEPFWDDPHISEMMLSAHLSPDTDGASRRLETIDRSVQWLSTQILSGGKVLDLGCGPGLYTKRLSDMGYDVTGVDLSKRSINYAKGADPKTKYVCQDYLTLDDKAEYDAITMIYCDYGALTKTERENILSKIYRMLKPNGSFIFDVFSDACYQQKKEEAEWAFHENGGFWCAEPHLCIGATYMYDNLVSAEQYVVVTKENVKNHIIWDTAYTKESLTRELQAAGLKVKSFFGDVCGSEYDEQSETLCCIATK